MVCAPLSRGFRKYLTLRSALLLFLRAHLRRRIADGWRDHGCDRKPHLIQAALNFRWVWEWRVPRMAGPGRFPSEFRANSGQIPSKFRANSGQIPSKFRANSEQIPGKVRANSRQIPSKFRANSEQESQTLYFLVVLCNKSPWLAATPALGVKPTMRGT